MQFEIAHRPAYALAKVTLDADEAVVAEGSAMVSMDTHITVESSMSAGSEGGGLMKGLMSGLKRMVAGESLFQNTFTSAGRGGAITFAPKIVGDIEVHELDGSTGLMLQSTAFLCAAPSIELDTKWGGARSFFGGEGLFLLKASGSGPIAFNSFGAIKHVDVDGEYIVDNGHIVAFEDTLEFRNTKFGGGWIAAFLGGEGSVCRFSGTGRLWLQTRNPQGFGEALGPKLPQREH